MVLLKKVDIPPPTPKKKKTSADGGFKSKIKKSFSERKRPLNEDSIFGEEIFAQNVRREKEIVIHFHPFTQNNLRISSDGKFIIEKIDPTEDYKAYKWNLFYYETPITDFSAPTRIEDFKQIVYEIKEEAFTVALRNIEDLEILKTKTLEFVKLEFLEDRKKKLQDLRDQDEEDRKEKELQDLAEDALEEAKDDIDSLTNDSNTNTASRENLDS